MKPPRSNGRNGLGIVVVPAAVVGVVSFNNSQDSVVETLLSAIFVSRSLAHHALYVLLLLAQSALLVLVLVARSDV